MGCDGKRAIFDGRSGKRRVDDEAFLRFALPASTVRRRAREMEQQRGFTVHDTKEKRKLFLQR